jgi:hypothetical protein
MKGIFLQAVALLLFSTSAAAQENDDNISILKSVRKFRFEAGNAENPVLIKEEYARTYTCKKYRTDVPISELYNGVETIDDVDIKVNGSSKWLGITPQHEYYNRDGIFYSDERICYFNLPIEKINTQSEVVFKKTTKDPRYFTNVFFIDEYGIQEQEVKLYVPSWMELEIKEYNFEKYKIEKSKVPGSNETVYTYSMRNIPKINIEKSAPGFTYFAPHILVLCKSAQPKGTPVTYFKTVKEQYDWYQSLVKQIGDDEAVVKAKAEEIAKGATNDEEKVKKVFLWVQENIRYIAFENGIAGFKPEKSNEVLRKKYGDCKGMANLLTVMLRSLKLDARRCWIGTKHIAYDYSTPSLSVDNHMICAWMKNGKPVYLDATEKYIGYGEIAERIQGRQTLIENGTNYLLEKVPLASHLQNTATETRKLTIEGTHLKGHVVHVWKGENKEWLLSALADIKQDKQENALRQYLSEGENVFQISNLVITNLNDYNSDLKIEYDILWKDAVTVFDKEAYMSLDNRLEFKDFTIDTTKRKLPYWMHFKNHVILDIELTLPTDKTPSEIPAPVTVKQTGYYFNASYSNGGNKLQYKKEIVMSNTEINPQQFKQWNSDIQKLSEFYNQQIVLTSKK